MRLILTISAVTAALFGAGLLLLLSGDAPETVLEGEKYDVRPYVEIVNPSGFVNTDGQEIQFADYIGEKVILFDFMTYSCINCQRVFPYLNAWYETYQDDGLIVIGVHTPEFAFERNIENVEDAMGRFGIEFPVILDNEYSTWRAYGNRFWPRKYLIDIHGNIVYDHIGEGAYDETEEKIIELLKDRAEVLGADMAINGPQASEFIDPFVHKKKSPETYVGTSRNEDLLNAPEDQKGITSFIVPEQIKGGGFYLGGTWAMTGEYAQSLKNSNLIYRYEGEQVYLVAGSAESVSVEVWQDGELVTDSAGEDVKNGVVEIGQNRLYKLIDNSESGEHVLELRIKGSGVRLFAFTFG